jgi:tRNA (guanine37-N1)-methyltransferase
VTIHVLTLFPGLIEAYASSSVLGRAGERGLVLVRALDIRDFAADRHRSCDDAPYGGGAGMVLMPEPVGLAIESVRRPGVPVIYLSPGGRLFNQGRAEELATREEIVLLCGRYEGVDQRVIDLHVTEELSIGDYVLAGGEVAAMVVIDAVARLLQGVIRDDSLREESFAAGPDAGGRLLEYPHYTRPETWRGLKVPEVLLTGHHARIAAWRRERSVEKTQRVRPDLLERPWGHGHAAERAANGIEDEQVTQGDTNGCDQGGRGGGPQDGPGRSVRG